MKTYPDLGKLILRIALGTIMLMHGVHKLLHGHDYVRKSLAEVGLPEFLWLGVPLAEVIAPILLILGLASRVSSLLIAFTMIMTFYLVLGIEGFQLNQYGGFKGELNILIFFSALALFLTGPGRYSLYNGSKR